MNVTEDLKDFSLLSSVNASDFSKVYVFEKLAVILRENGNLCGIGLNQHNLIWSGDQNYVYTYVDNISTDGHFKDFFTNGEHALAISKEGLLYSWGCNTHGQLGRSGEVASVKPVDKMIGVRIKEAVCGAGFSCVLTEDGRVFEWGVYGFNELVLASTNGSEESDVVEENDGIASIHGTKHYLVILSKKGRIATMNFMLQTKERSLENREGC